INLTACSYDGAVIVTEWGFADLRELTVGEKALALASISHPSCRDELLRYVTDDPMFTKPVGFSPGQTPRGVQMYDGNIAIGAN
ncbi:MAG: acetyl-CoA hydrolase/transferase C-terminal domain-containing protein, partial [Hyphomicrobiales bacterium]